MPGDLIMTIKPIHSKTAYNAALRRVEELMDADFDTPEGDELEVLTTLISAYEDKEYPVDIPDAVSAIRFVMDQRGYEQKDFAALIGKSRASEILNKKRGLSMKQARTLHKKWNVPAEALLAG